MDIVNLLRGSSSTLNLLQKPGHKAHIAIIGWGEPPSYHTQCSCGWRGRTFETFTPELVIAPLKELAKSYGWEALLPEDSLYGTGEDAAQEVLAHLELPLTSMLKERHEKLLGLFQKLSTLENWNEEDGLALQELSRATTILNAVKAFTEEKHGPSTRTTPFNIEIYERYKAVVADYYEAQRKATEQARSGG